MNNAGAKGTVKLGNWQEEQALFKMIGDQYDPKNKETSLLTKERVIYHDDNIEPKNFKSVLSGTYNKPQDHHDYLVVNNKGPRQRKQESLLKERVEKEYAESVKQKNDEANQMCLESTAGAAYKCQNFKSTINEHRRVNGSNSRVRKPQYHDPNTDPAVTFYLHTAQNDGIITFPVSNISSVSNPWTKATASSGSVKNGLLRNNETFENPGITPSIYDYPVLRKLRARIISACSDKSGGRVPGLALRLLSQTLAGLDNVPMGRVGVDTVVETIDAEIGVICDHDEINCLIKSFSRNNSDDIILIELIEFLRGKMPNWRVELIGTAFNSIVQLQGQSTSMSTMNGLDTRNGVTVSENDIMKAFDSVSAARLQGFDSPETVLGYFLDSMHVYNFDGVEFGYCKNDFLEYYRDVSTETPNDEAFMDIIKAAWGVEWQ